MTALARNTIATTLEEDSSASGRSRRGNIDTESQREADPAWKLCVDALEEVWKNPAKLDDGLVTPPTRRAIEAAIDWVTYLRNHWPTSPPTLITVEPAGGIIVERSERTPRGEELLVELTFYNDATAEFTAFEDGRVVQMRQIPFQPAPRFTP